MIRIVLSDSTHRFVIVPLLGPSHVLGADWGFDATFCGAGKAYAMEALHSGADIVPCAVIVHLKEVKNTECLYVHFNYRIVCHLTSCHFSSYSVTVIRNDSTILFLIVPHYS
jgi:hypothetical protein